MIGGGGNGGFLGKIGQLIENILDNLDEIAAAFHHIPIIRHIAEQLDNLMDLFKIYQERGTPGLIAGVAILAIIISITALMAYALSELLLLSAIASLSVFRWTAFDSVKIFL